MRGIIRVIIVVAILGSAGWLQMNGERFEEIVRNAVDDDDDETQLLSLQAKERWLVLVIDFPSKASGAGSDPARAEAMLTGERSASDYIFQMSGGSSELEVVVHPIVYSAASEVNVYGLDVDGERDVGTEGVDPAKLVEEAVSSALAAVNLSDYDLNGDGRLDRLLLMHTGRAQENGGRSSDIWSHFSYLMDPIEVNGTEIAHYTMASFDSGLGTILHEMIHQMGAIDLYDVHSDLPTNNWNGVGDWDIMASGNWNGNGREPALPMAATLRLIGAEREYTILHESIEDNPMTFNLTPLSAGGMSVRVESAPGEWAWIEHRGDIGFDKQLPGAGVLVSYQDDGAGDIESNEVNNDPAQPWLRVVEADGNDGLVRGVDSGRQGDLFSQGGIFGAEGVQIRDRHGRLVDWRAEVISLNSTVAMINISATNTSEVLPPRNPIELLSGETIPISITAKEACTPWTMLDSSDTREAQLRDLSEISAGSTKMFQLGWIDAVLAPASGTLTGTIGCGSGTGRDVVLSWHVVAHRITTTEWSGEIHWQNPTMLDIPLEYDGKGSRDYDIVIEGPLERIATTAVTQTLSNGTSVTIEVAPSGLLVQGMLADGELVIADDAGFKHRIQLSTIAVEEQPEDPYSWFRAPVNTVTVLLVLLALTILTGGSKKASRRERMLEQRAGEGSTAYQSILEREDFEAFDRQHIDGSYSHPNDPFAGDGYSAVEVPESQPHEMNQNHPSAPQPQVQYRSETNSQIHDPIQSHPGGDHPSSRTGEYSALQDVDESESDFAKMGLMNDLAPSKEDSQRNE